MYRYVIVLKKTGEPIVHSNNKADLEKLIWDLPNGTTKWEIKDNLGAWQMFSIGIII